MKRLIACILSAATLLTLTACSIAPLAPASNPEAASSTKAPMQNDSYSESIKATPKVTVAPDATADLGMNYMGFLPTLESTPKKVERTAYGVSLTYNVISVDEFDSIVNAFTENGFVIDAAFSGMKYSGMRSDGVFASIQVGSIETYVEIYSTLMPTEAPTA